MAPSIQAPTHGTTPLVSETKDILILGGGLLGGLLALRLSQTHPELKFRVLERGSTWGGEHTWSFHTSDLEPQHWSWIKPLVTKSWPSYRVKFPLIERTVEGGYHSIVSEDFHERLAPLLQHCVSFGEDVQTISRDGNLFQVKTSKQTYTAQVVLDARGFRRCNENKVGYQKFVGLDVETDGPHGVTTPLLMDATIEQVDGYRFFYLLPWSETRILIEDTYYSDDAKIDVTRLEAEVRTYAEKNGIKIKNVKRVEVGALPIPLLRDHTLPEEASPGLEIGVKGGFFHSTTGYSFPIAVKMAHEMADLPVLKIDHIEDLIRAKKIKHEEGERFFRLLNRMLFKAAEPKLRYKVLERFFHLPIGLIQRFFAHEMTFTDRARVLAGKPPVPLLKALACMREESSGMTIAGVRT